MKIVFLDAKSVGEDIDLSKYNELGDFVTYDFTTPEQLPSRVADADVIITNKCTINESSVGNAKNLKLVCVTATGTNNLDKPYLEQKGIAWRNVAGYSTESVAQHTFAMLFYLLEKLSYYDAYVKDGKYANDTSFTHFAEHFHEINGKTWGIIGLGNIGSATARMAQAMGMKVMAISSKTEEALLQIGVQKAKNYEQLFSEADVISLHCPLTDDTHHIINQERLSLMKSTAIIINTGRGPLLDEEAVAEALLTKKIYAVGIDVLTEEPPLKGSPLISAPRCYITPHIAWASKAARRRLIDIAISNVKAFACGEPQNQV
jgi:glycerate dehydrogenase